MEPLRGEPKACGAVESTLRTWRAACSSPAKQTTAPNPAVTGAAAADAASIRLAGPSAPGAEAGRIAPVTTIGGVSGPASARASHSTASSSIVSVPLVSTTPRPRAVSETASRATASASAVVTCGPLTARSDRASTRSAAGSPALSAAASSWGVAPGRPAAPSTDEMVPPTASRVTSRTRPPYQKSTSGAVRAGLPEGAAGPYNSAFASGALRRRLREHSP